MYAIGLPSLLSVACLLQVAWSICFSLKLPSRNAPSTNRENTNSAKRRLYWHQERQCLPAGVECLVLLLLENGQASQDVTLESCNPVRK